MTLRRLQAAFAELVLDDAAYATFRRNPVAFAARRRLDEPTLRALTEMDARGFELYRRGVAEKRRLP